MSSIDLRIAGDSKPGGLELQGFKGLRVQGFSYVLRVSGLGFGFRGSGFMGLGALGLRCFRLAS